MERRYGMALKPQIIGSTLHHLAGFVNFVKNTGSTTDMEGVPRRNYDPHDTSPREIQVQRTRTTHKLE
jgi:hypothetical protein